MNLGTIKINTAFRDFTSDPVHVCQMPKSLRRFAGLSALFLA